MPTRGKLSVSRPTCRSTLVTSTHDAPRLIPPGTYSTPSDRSTPTLKTPLGHLLGSRHRRFHGRCFGCSRASKAREKVRDWQLCSTSPPMRYLSTAGVQRRKSLLNAALTPVVFQRPTRRVQGSAFSVVCSTFRPTRREIALH